MRDRYGSAASFRSALEQRLRAEAFDSGIPLNRLRKDAAFNRLLARLHKAAPDDWALKGGLALIGRLGAGVRATKDADANWRGTRSDLEEALATVEDSDLGDWFSFTIGDARPLHGEGAEGALRYSVQTTLAGRTFEQLTLDVNVIDAEDQRPIELVTLRRNPFEFIGEPVLRIPMVTPAQQLAEKLHAYTRIYQDERSSRAKDLFDMLVIAEQISLPPIAGLSAAVQDTFRLRSTDWPPQLDAPPADWDKPWVGFIADYPLRWHTLADAYGALAQFWAPVLAGSTLRDTEWDQETWNWANVPV